MLFRNVFTRCSVTVSSFYGGNAYGGGVSVYIGGYSSVTTTGAALAQVGDTVVRNVSVTLHAARFTSCSSVRSGALGTLISNTYGGNVYGGSFSFYIGAYSWISSTFNSSSKCGSTIASVVNVSVLDTHCYNCRAMMTSADGSYGVSSYGGSISALHIGAYSWSYSESSQSSSSSECGSTIASTVSVSVHDAPCYNCSAVTTSGGSSYGASSYGGSISAVYIGSHVWSYSFGGLGTASDSSCDLTRVVSLLVSISGSLINHTTAISSEISFLFNFHSHELTHFHRADTVGSSFGSTVRNPSCGCTFAPAFAHDCCAGVRRCSQRGDRGHCAFADWHG